MTSRAFKGGGRLAEVIEMIQPVQAGHANDCIALITCFLDESGTHGRASGNTVVAGFLGNKDDWQIFEDGWLEIIKSYPELGTIHGKDLLPKRGIYFKLAGREILEAGYQHRRIDSPFESDRHNVRTP